MFKSIEYRSSLSLFFLVAFTIAATYLLTNGHIFYGALTVVGGIICFSQLRKHYKKYNQSILFLFNALENGDYSFWFSEDKSSKRERELNSVLNRIKFILTKARKDVIKNEESLSLIVESVSTGIVIVDYRGVVYMVNQAAMNMFGLPVFTHLNQLGRVDKTFPGTFGNLTSGQTVQITFSNEREDIQVSVNVSKIVLKGREMRIFTLNNIGNELGAKEMESWIKLIRVMTHEIMNSTAPITSISSTMLDAYSKKTDTNEDPLVAKTIEAFETISTTAKGLLSFVQSYRKFTGLPKPDFKSFDLIPVLNKVIYLNNLLLEQKSIKVAYSYSQGSFMLNADELQVTQVLVNLIKNAIESFGEDKNGEIAIFLQDGSNPRISVSNNGKPIPPEIIPHMFVPFFTTKETGTGIGLSISRYIMRLHGGNLKYHSADGYTVFTMSF